MPHLLRLDASISRESRTRVIGDAYERAWLGRGEEYSVTRRDLVAEPLPHFDSPDLHWPEHLRETPHAAPALEALQEAALEEIRAADSLLIGAPTYNFSMPSQLKAWIDLIHVPGLTAPFGANGSQPFKGKPAAVVSARGGTFDIDAHEPEHVLAPIRLVLERGLGMDVVSILVTRTLAHRLPDLDEQRADAEMQSAIRAAERHAKGCRQAP